MQFQAVVAELLPDEGLVGGDGLGVGAGGRTVLIEIGGVIEGPVGIQNDIDRKVIAVRRRGEAPGSDERVNRLSTFRRGCRCRRRLSCGSRRSGLGRNGIVRTGGQHGDHHQNCKQE